MVTLSTQHDLALTHHHPLPPRLRIITAHAVIEDGDPEPAPPIAPPAPQPELQIEDERIQRQPIPALQKSPRILDTAPAAAAHHDHFMRGQIAEPQPPIALFLLRFYENKIRTLATLVHPFCGPRQNR